MKDLSVVRPIIEKMWKENERSAIAQEIVNDVSHDLEDGDSFVDVARRFELKLQTTSPLKKGQEFAGLPAYQLLEAYQEKLGQPKIFANDNKIIIVATKKVVRNANKLSKEKVEALRAKAQSDLTEEMSKELIDAYGSNYKVRVKYKYLGLTD